MRTVSSTPEPLMLTDENSLIKLAFGPASLVITWELCWLKEHNSHTPVYRVHANF